MKHQSDPRPSPGTMPRLLREIAACAICEGKLPHEPRPLVQGSSEARIVVIGQAPGMKAHASGIPWHDASGSLLREWLGMDDATFYNPKVVALLPMGFCYPGKGIQGDLPPRAECAPQWHDRFLKRLHEVRLVLLIGKYAQGRYLARASEGTLTETVRAFRKHPNPYFPLPHPSPRNRPWMTRNPWFATEVLPSLREQIREIIKGSIP